MIHKRLILSQSLNARNLRAVTLVLGACVLASCSVLDSYPKGGFPENQSKGLPYLELAPESTFDFHQNPAL